MTEINIKNMVCPRCVAAVEQMLADCGFSDISVGLGRASFAEHITPADKEQIRERLRQLGFDLLENAQAVTVEEIRQQVMQWVRLRGMRPNLSDYLQEHIHKEYSALSKLFSEMRGITIERYSLILRMEYAKELLCYAQHNINEIADILGFSSAAHFSARFKQETGMSPTVFRKGKAVTLRRPIDSL